MAPQDASEGREKGARWTKPRLKAYAINFLISLIVGYFFGFLAFAGTLFALELIGVMVAVATGKNP